MNTTSTALVIATIATLICAACDETEGIACDRDFRPAIAVDVLDSITSQHIHSDSIRVTAVSPHFAGFYADTVRPTLAETMFNHAVWVADDRPGIYTVTVTAPGYEVWSIRGVEVPVVEQGCHVRTAPLTARLQPSFPHFAERT